MAMRQKIWLTWGAALLLAATLMAPRALAAPVRIDRGFGSKGIARTPLPPAYESERFSEVAPAPDGGVLARIYEYGGTDNDHFGPDGSFRGEEASKEAPRLQPPEAKTADGGRVVGAGVVEGPPSGTVTRYRADGSLDTSFGDGGTTESLPLAVEALATLPSGKVLAAGPGVYIAQGGRTPGQNQLFVARLGADGKLDPSFGNGGLVALNREDKVPDTSAFEVQGRAGGGAEVVGESQIVALDGSGKLDPGFGEGGKVATLGGVVGAATAGEGVLVAGDEPRSTASRPATEGPREFYVARYTAAGGLDKTYGGGSGIATFAQEVRAEAETARFEADGSVLVGGLVVPPSTDCPRGYLCHQTPAVARFTPAGAPDGAFGQGGLALLSDLAVRISSFYSLYGVDALAARPGGGILAAGEFQGGAFVAALGTDGAPVGGFGSGGVVTRSSARPAYASPLATGVDASGRIYVLAETDSGISLAQAAVVLRYSPDGKLDRGYGEDGHAYVSPAVSGLAVAPDGSTFVTSGHYPAGSDEPQLTELTPAGTPDPSFGSGGSVLIRSSGRHPFTPSAVARVGDGDLLVAGERGPGRAAVFRFLPDGRLGRRFGTNGLALPDLRRNRHWEVATMTVDRRGRILLGGTAPRRHSHACCTEESMVIRLDADGGLDRRFGRGGVALVGGKGVTAVEGLAMRGDHVLAVATAGRHDHPSGDLLYSLRSDGRLDRGFGDRGVARAPVPAHRKHDRGADESLELFSTPKRVLLVRAGSDPALISFSPRGRPQHGFPGRLKGLFPHRQTLDLPASPIATLDGKSLVLAWPARPIDPRGEGLQSEVNLQRLLLR